MFLKMTLLSLYKLSNDRNYLKKMMIRSNNADGGQDSFSKMALEEKSLATPALFMYFFHHIYRIKIITLIFLGSSTPLKISGYVPDRTCHEIQTSSPIIRQPWDARVRADQQVEQFLKIRRIHRKNFSSSHFLSSMCTYLRYVRTQVD